MLNSRATHLILLFAFACACLIAPTASHAKIRWKCATLAPDGVGWAKHMKTMVLPAAKEATNGDLAIKIYWGGVMGDDEDFINKMKVGQLQGAGFTGAGATLICPEMNVLELPFLFNSFEEVDYIKEKMQATFDGLMRENGVFLLAWIDQDFDQVYSLEYPLSTVEDFQKPLFLTWYGKLEEDLFRVLKVRSIPVAVPDAARSLHEGQTNAAICPALWMVGSQMFSKIKWVNTAKIRYSPAVIAISNKAWDATPDHHRQALIEMRTDLMARFCREVRKDNAQSLKAMISYGVQEAKMPPAQLALMKKTTRPIWDDLADDLYPRELLDELLANLAEYRGESPARFTTVSSTAARPRPVSTGYSAASAKPAASRQDVQAGLTWEQKREQLKKVQDVLKQYGFYTLAIDGLMGPRTFWGIKKYQRAKGLEVTGAVDAPLLESMGIK